MDKPDFAFAPDVYYSFGQRIASEIEAVKEKIASNPQQPELDSLDSWESRTGERAAALREHYQKNGRNEQLLKSLEAAQRRCDEGTFGWCLGCGKVISEERLEIAIKFGLTTDYCCSCLNTLSTKKG